jgi:rare lipoprotein A
MANARYLLLGFVSIAVLLAGCSPTGTRKGGYYQDDGPGDSRPSHLDSIPDAVPRIEPLASGANRPYTVLGKRYTPAADPDHVYRARGTASWYGKKFHGNSTSIGESYDMYAMTAAHPTMPLPSYARVTSSVNGRTIIVRINDRGPFHSDRIIDLSYTAAHKLGIIAQGSAEVVVERILPSEIRSAASQGTTVRVSDQDNGATVSVTPLAEPAVAMTTLPPIALSPPVAMTSGGVYLQIGAFSQPANAQALAQRVNSQLDHTTGLNPAAVHQSGTLYRVRLGPYSDRNTAMNAAQKITNQTGVVPSLATY